MNKGYDHEEDSRLYDLLKLKGAEIAQITLGLEDRIKKLEAMRDSEFVDQEERENLQESIDKARSVLEKLN